MAVENPTIANPGAQGAKITKPRLSEFIADSATRPGRLIDGRPFLRDEIREKTGMAAAQCEAILASFAADDDAGALHGVRRLVAFVRHAGTAAGWLDAANHAAHDLQAAKVARRAGAE